MSGPVLSESRVASVGGFPVRRALPRRERRTVGAWCFIDHMGPGEVVGRRGIGIGPHPHIGLQTVTWLVEGEVLHRDSLGSEQVIRPGQLNLMTAGRGVSHSEEGTGGYDGPLHGVQLWLALPDAHRDAPRNFQHYAPPTIVVDGSSVRVFLGSLAGSSSPVTTFTPLLGAEIVLPAGATLSLAVAPSFEHGVLLDTGDVTIGETTLTPGALGYVGTGRSTLTLSTRDGARVVLLGGEPFGEEIVMWWNFVGRTHDDIAAYRDEWQAETDRFGRVEGYAGARLPAPPLPGGRLRPRGNPA